MGRLVLYMPMSLDGFIAAPDDRVGELEIHLVPVLLGDGRRLFEGLGTHHIELGLVRVVDAPGVTHLRYRVQGAQ